MEPQDGSLWMGSENLKDINAYEMHIGFWMMTTQDVALDSLTLWGRYKMAAIFQTTYSNAFSWIKMHEFCLRFYWSLFLVPINNIPALVQIMAWCRPGDKPWSEPMMVSLLTHIRVTRPRWVKAWTQSMHSLKTKCLVVWSFTSYISWEPIWICSCGCHS